MSPARTRLALAGAAVVLFGASFAVGKASGGDETTEGSTSKPKSAKEVEVPDSATNVPSLTAVGSIPKLKPKPEPESSTTHEHEHTSSDTSTSDTSTSDTSTSDTSTSDTSTSDTSTSDTSTSDTSTSDTSTSFSTTE